MIRTAKYIDLLAARVNAFVVEDYDSVIVSNLSASVTKRLLKSLERDARRGHVLDCTNEACDVPEIVETLAPFKVQFQKETTYQEDYYILTNTFFAETLTKHSIADVVRVARLGRTLYTWRTTFSDWSLSTPDRSEPVDAKTPKAIVKYGTNTEIIPNDIRSFIKKGHARDGTSSQAERIWMQTCIERGVASLGNSVDEQRLSIVFDGPPSKEYILSPVGETSAPLQGTFDVVQRVLGWVFEAPRETEIRHNFFSVEFARATTGYDNIYRAFYERAANALESAKVAERLRLSDISKDALNSISDLRSSVTEETGKIAESARQLTTALAAAISIGVGLVVVRLSFDAHWLLVVASVTVMMLYVGGVITTGLRYIDITKRMRRDWRDRLYYFIPPDDYEHMVEGPAGRAEKTFKVFAWISGAIVFFVTVAVVAFWFTAEPLA